MPKKAKELTALDIKRISRPGRHAVGNVPGLLLNVKEDSGSKSWMLRTVIGNKRRTMGLGGYPEVTLAQAREKACKIREDIRQGVDPFEERKANKMALIKSQLEQMTFAETARLCHEKKSSEFKSEKHKRDWIRSI